MDPGDGAASGGRRPGPAFEELVARTRGVQPWRRVLHAATGCGLALGPGALGWSSGTTALLVGGGTAILLAGDLARLRLPTLNRWFFRTFSRLASPREADSLASSTWYGVGATAVWAAVPGLPAVCALLVLGLADPAASVVGRVWGRRPVGKGTRAGTAVFVGVAWLTLVGLVGPVPALGVAVTAAISEVLPLGIDDNLVVPLVTGVAVQALGAAGLLPV